ncbi:MAG: LolA family protein [Ginsengibacter sp.]
MLKILLPAIFLLCATSVFSQNNKLGTSDPDAKVILDKVSATFKTYKTVTANFTLTITNAANKVEGSKSGIIYTKGSKYRVNISGQEIYSDGANIWTYDKSANEVQLTKFDAASNTITPQKMFTDFYDKDFLYKLNDEKKEGGKLIQEIELTPIDKTKPFFKVLVYVDKATSNIISSKVFEKNGNHYIYKITSMKTNTTLPDSLFTFDSKKYPKAEIIDLR